MDQPEMNTAKPRRVPQHPGLQTSGSGTRTCGSKSAIEHIDIEIHVNCIDAPGERFERIAHDTVDTVHMHLVGRDNVNAFVVRDAPVGSGIDERLDANLENIRAGKSVAEQGAHGITIR